MIVIFDVDGVLIDTTKSYHTAIHSTAKYFLEKDKIDKEIKREDLLDIKYQLGINNDWDATFAGILFYKTDLDKDEFIKLLKNEGIEPKDIKRVSENLGIKLPEYDELIETFESIYEKERINESLIFSKKDLETIKNMSTNTAVITGRPFSDMDFSFKYFDIYHYFDHIITEGDISNPAFRKPSPYSLYKLFTQIDYKEPTIYIGDTLADLMMVNNFNRIDDKKVEFVLMENPKNTDLKVKNRVKSPKEFIEFLKERKKCYQKT